MANTVEKGLVSKSALTAIGDAIRAKNGSTTKYKPSEMAAAISNLKGGDFTVATSDKFNFRVVQSANQTINSTPTGKTVSNSDGTVSLALTDTTTISPNTNYVPGTIQRSYDDSTHTYTVTATNAEPIDGLVQNGWSVVYQKNPSDSDFYTNADYTGTAVTQDELQGNILVGGMQSYSNNSTTTYPSDANKILKFKNTFITSASKIFLANCTSLSYVELPNLTEVGKYSLTKSAITSLELPNLTKAGDYLLMDCPNIRSVELPKLTNLIDIDLPSSSASSPAYFIDCGYATNINPTIFRYTRVIVLRAHTIQTNFEQSELSDPVLYIVPSALVGTYRSKIRVEYGDCVTALENSPFADGKTVCGNNMETAHTVEDLGDGKKLLYNFSLDRWTYADNVSHDVGFYFLSKLTKEQGYTIPPHIPSGKQVIVSKGDYFNVPDGVKVIKVYMTAENPEPDHVVYVGVTPGSQHTFNIKISSVPGSNPVCSLICMQHLDVRWDSAKFHPKYENEISYTLEWSPEINKKTPTVTDYN